jgi:AcrR family transcriptional regulator
MAAAFDLFGEKGFAAVTVDELAAAVGLSKRSFFRYFGSKEDVVLDDLANLGRALAVRLAARPASEGPWEAVRAAFTLLEEQNDAAPERTFRLLRMLHATPGLRASHLEKRSRWHELLAPHLVDRLPADLRPAAARVLAGAALACLDVAQEMWLAAPEHASLGALLDRLMPVVQPLDPGEVSFHRG